MFSLPDCGKFLGTPLLHPDPAAKVSEISIDSRSLLSGDFFIALKGNNTDGHRFLRDAMARGASGALVEAGAWQKLLDENSSPVSWRNILAVSDTREALVRLASWHRQSLDIPFLGITGSVGKTSTKEFLSYFAGKLLSAPSVLSTKKNFNNELGLPLSLLHLTEKHRMAVLELGASRAGDISYLCDILRPTGGILTCVAPSHMHGFGSLEGIYNAKLELFEALPSGSPAVIPDDDESLFQKASRYPVRLVRAGDTGAADYRVSQIRSTGTSIAFRFSGKGKTRDFEFPGSAPFMARNAAMALALLAETGFSVDKLPTSWSDFRLPAGRFSVYSLKDRLTVIFDGYNANPRSFTRALESLRQLAGNSRTACVAGDMLELGDYSSRYHEELGEFVGEQGIEALFAYGPMSSYTAKAAAKKFPQIRVYHSEKVDDIINPLMDYLRPGDFVLLKASRGMKVEKVFEALKDRFPPENPVSAG